MLRGCGNNPQSVHNKSRTVRVKVTHLNLNMIKGVHSLKYLERDRKAALECYLLEEKV